MAAVQQDVIKQTDVARSATHHKHQRHRRHVIQEERMMERLNDAELNDDEDMLNLVTLLGLQMQGYVAGLRDRNLNTTAGEGNNDPIEESLD